MANTPKPTLTVKTVTLSIETEGAAMPVTVRHKETGQLLVYLRAGSREAELFRLLSGLAEQADEAAELAKVPGARVLGELGTAVDALEVLDMFRSLSEVERGRLYRFAQDAIEREYQPKEEAVFAVLEAFASFVGIRERGEEPETIRHVADLSRKDYRRYVQAWRLVQSVHMSVEKRVKRRYGKGERRQSRESCRAV